MLHAQSSVSDSFPKYDISVKISNIHETLNKNGFLIL